VRGSAKLPENIKSNVASAPAKCKKILDLSFKKHKQILADGILSFIVSKKKIGAIITFKVRIVGKLEVSFIVQKGNIFSHGKTIKEAKDSFKYKIGTRDASEFKKWKLNTVVTQAKMIEAFRVITGACEYGVRNFCEGKKIPAKLSVKQAIKLVGDSYGSQQFKEFFL
jgi:hypothetical protein